MIDTELLLELARVQKGQRIEWDEWVDNIIQLRVGGDAITPIGIFGCRLSCITSDTGDEGGVLSHMWINDFSRSSRAKHLHALDSLNVGGRVRRWISPSLDGYKLP